MPAPASAATARSAWTTRLRTGHVPVVLDCRSVREGGGRRRSVAKRTRRRPTAAVETPPARPERRPGGLAGARPPPHCLHASSYSAPRALVRRGAEARGLFR